MLEHPALANGPVRIEALTGEVKAIDAERRDIAIVDLQLPGESEPPRLYVDVDVFDAMARRAALWLTSWPRRGA